MKKVFKCSMCGADAAPRTKFCPACGGAVYPVAPVAQEGEGASEAAPKKKLPVKLLAILAIALVVVVLAVVLIVNLLPKKSNALDIKRTVDVNAEFDSENEKTYFYAGGKKLDFSMDGDANIISYSLNGEVTLIKDEDGLLYFVKDSKLTKITTVEVASYKLSTEGKAVAYVDEDGALFLYKIKDKKATKISDMLYASSYQLSPDGNTVAYAEGEDDEFSMIVWVDGKKTEYGDNLRPVGVSNKGKLVYYHNIDKEAVYVTKGKDKEPVKLLGDISASASYYSIIFNADHTEAIFSDGEKFYAVEDGKEKVKISSKNISSAHMSRNSKSFKKQYYIDSDKDLYYIGSNWEPVKIASDVASFRTSESGDVVYYRDADGNLYRGKGYGNQFTKIADEVKSSYVINPEGTQCYYMDDDANLYYVKKTEKAKKVAADVDEFDLSQDGYCFMIVDRGSDGGTLYYSKNGGEKKKVVEEVVDLYCENDATYYCCIGADEELLDLYGTAKKADFKLIIKGLAD